MHGTGKNEKFGGMKVKGCGVLSGEDILKLTTVMVVLLCECTEKPLNQTL